MDKPLVLEYSKEKKWYSYLMFEPLQDGQSNSERAENLIKVGKYDLNSAVLHLEKKKKRIIMKIQTLMIHFNLQVTIKII